MKDQLSRPDFMLFAGSRLSTALASLLLTLATIGGEINQAKQQESDDQSSTEVVYVTEALQHGIRIVLENPRIFIGNSSVSGGRVPDSDEVEEETYGFSFDGLFVRVQGHDVCINENRIQTSDLPKNIWISDDLKKVRINGMEVKMLRIPQDYKNIDMEHFVVDELPGGFQVITKGGIMPCSAGISFGGKSFIFDRHGIITKIWGDELFVWGKRLGKLSEIADKDKKIHLNFKDLIEVQP